MFSMNVIYQKPIFSQLTDESTLTAETSVNKHAEMIHLTLIHVTITR